MASELGRLGLQGQRVLVLHPPGPGFVTAFLGCLAARVVAVPAYPPGPVRSDSTLDRLAGIVADCRPAAALVETSQLARLPSLADRHGPLAALAWIDTEAVPLDAAASWDPPADDDESLAFLQYTSGSTMAPKGVMVTHRNLTANARRIGTALNVDEHTRGLSWLPPYHDMGLIGFIVQPLSFGLESVLMPPTAFLQRPMRWLEAISRHRATVSFAPNFAYDLVLRRLRPEQLERLDLRSWVTAGNGAEPVRAETIRRFSETFAACGFGAGAFCPSYGLAECTLLVSSRHGLRVQSADRNALEEDAFAPVDPAAADAQPIVSVGPPGEGLEVRIVAAESGVAQADDRIGEIWVRGPSVAAGYWNQPDETRATFGARVAGDPETAEPYLRTGDLGFVHDGELHITGRLKDLIVIDGRNHYPQDIELTVESHAAVRPGGAIAFTVDQPGGEQLVVVAERPLRRPAAPGAAEADLTEAARAIRALVAERHGVPLRALTWVGPGSLPRTGTGKPQRRACRAEFLRGETPDVVART